MITSLIRMVLRKNFIQGVIEMMSITEIEKGLMNFTGTFPKKEVEQAIKQQEEMTPILLNSLDYANENADSLRAEDSDYWMHTYAMYLLAQFREKSAFPKLIEMMAREDETVDFLIGDTITEDYHKILFSTFDGNVDLLKKVIEDSTICEFSRDSAMRTYAMLYEKNMISKEEIIDYIQYLVDDKLTEDYTYVMTSIVNCIGKTRLLELIPYIKRIFEREAVWEGSLGTYEEVVRDISNNTYGKIEKFYIDDTVKEMEWWHCFDENTLVPFGQHKKEASIQKDDAYTFPKAEPVRKEYKNVGRNDSCPCGSGKKFKKCCMNK